MGDKLDELLFDALREEEEPSPMLNRRILAQANMEGKKMKQGRRNLAAAAAITLCIVAAGGGTVYGAYRYLTAGQVAKSVSESEKLAEAFESEDALQGREVQESGAYTFRFLGLVSGTDLERIAVPVNQEELSEKKTYAAVAISRRDGGAMGEDSFCVSPLIGGVPFLVANNGTMGTSMTWFVQDGVLYELVECDDLEIFADRGVWLSVVENFGDESSAYTLKEDGTYVKNPEYDGVNALFQLPLDETKADRGAADRYLEELENRENQPDSAAEETGDMEERYQQFLASLKKLSADEFEDYYDPVPEHEVTAKPDADGFIDLTYQDEEGNTCGLSGQTTYLMENDEDYSIQMIFGEDSKMGFTVQNRNGDGSFTLREYRER